MYICIYVYMMMIDVCGRVRSMYVVVLAARACSTFIICFLLKVLDGLSCLVPVHYCNNTYGHAVVVHCMYVCECSCNDVKH